MCGICGIIERAPSSVAARFIADALTTQMPRGPDFHRACRFTGEWGSCTLGHNRLSIIDLTSDGHQPMTDTAGELRITYNGEIYNYIELRQELAALGYVFRSRSDTEVILAAYRQWGLGCAERFNGMFAFALLDQPRRQLHLVRDRFGVKPLFYHRGNGRVLFASTAGPIARAIDARPDLEYVSRGLTLRVYEADDERSPYVAVRAALPGHAYSISLDDDFPVVSRRWYDLTPRVQAAHETLSGLDAAEVTLRLRETLQDAVQLRLRADVPVAVSLSGGLDSGTITALAARGESKILAFSHAHPAAPRSEGTAVEAMRRALGIEVHYIWPDVRAVAPSFWSCLEAQDAPFFSTSVMAQYLVFEEARRHGIKVMLGGQGADEIFMGYRKYQAFHLRQLLHGGQFGLASRTAVYLARTLAAETGQFTTYWRAARRYVGGHRHESALHLPASSSLSLGHRVDMPLWHRQAVDVCALSLPTLLRYEDRNSMGNSIESRLPFMDYRLVEFGLALPVTAKLQRGYGKWVVRDAMQDLVPNEVRLSRTKRGFDAGSLGWFADGLGGQIRSRLHDASRLLRSTLDIVVDPSHFTDDRLARHPQSFADAVSALWLAQAIP